MKLVADKTTPLTTLKLAKFVESFAQMESGSVTTLAVIGASIKNSREVAKFEDLPDSTYVARPSPD